MGVDRLNALVNLARIRPRSFVAPLSVCLLSCSLPPFCSYRLFIPSTPLYTNMQCISIGITNGDAKARGIPWFFAFSTCFTGFRLARGSFVQALDKFTLVSSIVKSNRHENRKISRGPAENRTLAEHASDSLIPPRWIRAANGLW